MEPPRTLEGRRILLTRERAENRSLAKALAARGAVALVLPTIETVAHDPENAPEVRRAWNRLRWVAFASKNGVRFFRGWLDAVRMPLPPTIRIAAVGSGTADACAAAGFRVDEIPESFTGADLATHLAARHEPGPILLPRGTTGREELAQGLSAAGWEVFALPLYETRRAALDPGVMAELEQGVDAAVFASPSAVKSLLGQAPVRTRRALAEGRCVPIGPTTAEALRTAGIEPAAVPERYTPEGILAALEALFREDAP